MMIMYVRYLGTGVCWTITDGSERFYMGVRDELTPDEKKVCDEGGGDMPLSFEIEVVAW